MIPYIATVVTLILFVGAYLAWKSRYLFNRAGIVLSKIATHEDIGDKKAERTVKAIEDVRDVTATAVAAAKNEIKQEIKDIVSKQSDSGTVQLHHPAYSNQGRI